MNKFIIYKCLNKLLYCKRFIYNKKYKWINFKLIYIDKNYYYIGSKIKENYKLSK